jgi:hypothetical protein
MNTNSSVLRNIGFTKFKQINGCMCFFISIALPQLSSEIILKPNVDNYPQAKENIIASIKEAYETDIDGFFRQLQDSKTDTMFVDIDNEVVGNNAAAFAGDTLYVKNNFTKSSSSIYHEAWHSTQDLRMPRIDKLLPPYYAMYMNMVREAGANWVDTLIFEITHPEEAPKIPAGMTAEEFNHQRFNNFFEEFLNSQGYLSDSLDNLTNAKTYNIRKIGKNNYVPNMLVPDNVKYLDNIDGIMTAYMQAYLPDNYKLDHNLDYYLKLFEPILTKFDETRVSQQKTTFADLNNTLNKSIDIIPTLQNKKYGLGMSEKDLAKLDAIVAGLPHENTIHLTIKELLEKYNIQEN